MGKAGIADHQVEFAGISEIIEVGYYDVREGPSGYLERARSIILSE
jgi:hypothetical protein